MRDASTGGLLLSLVAVPPRCAMHRRGGLSEQGFFALLGVHLGYGKNMPGAGGAGLAGWGLQPPDSSSWVAVRGSAGASVPSTWDPETPLAAARPQPSGILLSGAVPAQKGCGGHLRLGKVVGAHSSSALSSCIGPSLRSLPKTHGKGPKERAAAGGEKMSSLWGSLPTPPS